MKLTTRNLHQKTSCRLVLRGVALLFAAVAAYAGPIHYTFTGTTVGSLDSPSHLQEFELTVPDFLPVVSNGLVASFLSIDPEVSSCTPCIGPPHSALIFLRGPDHGLIQFKDMDGINYAYFFSENVLSAPGTRYTLPGVNLNTGTLTVTAVPEPSTWSVLMIGLGVLAFGVHLRARRLPATKLGTLSGVSRLSGCERAISGPSIRHANASEESGICHRRDPDLSDRHRSQYRNLQLCKRGAAEAAAL